MVKLEDHSFEKRVLDTKYEVAIPVFVKWSTRQRESEIVSYSFCIDTAREFDKLYGKDPFSDGASAFLHSELDAVMGNMGYDTSEATGTVHYEYHYAGEGDFEPSAECEIIDTLLGERWGDLPLDEFELEPENPIDRMAVIRKRGKIVCFAGVNDVCDDDGMLEINVECEKKYRGRGYASSCAALLCRYLTGLGEKVKYITDEDNIASRKTAERIGLTLEYKNFPFLCYNDSYGE